LVGGAAEAPRRAKLPAPARAPQGGSEDGPPRAATSCLEEAVKRACRLTGLLSAISLYGLGLGRSYCSTAGRVLGTVGEATAT